VPPPAPPNLPRTGTSPWGLLWFGAVLILTGLGLTLRRPSRVRV
jgi:LPXTG-motif cell wall-anchored protein